MLRLEEVQFINWGPLRPDTVPFVTHDINLITGTNGSAKTCFLNGIKVILGVSLPKGSEAREWIFNPLALADINEAVAPADQALLRGTFCNPIAPGGHRFFSWEGGEFELAEHATVVCVVRRDGIRYRILPGRARWEEPLGLSVPRFLEQNPLGGQKWKGPRTYDTALSRMGVSQAMRGVLALPQGETGEILNETPAGLLRKILQLTGKQEIIDAYAEERKKFEQAEAKYRDTAKNLELEKATLERRKRDAEKYDEWIEHKQEYEHLRDVLIPAAKYRDAGRERDLRVRELEGLEQTIKTKGTDLQAKQQALPASRAELEAAEQDLVTVKRGRDSAGRRLRRLEGVVARFQTAAKTAKISYDRALELVAARGVSELASARSQAEREWKRSARALEMLELAIEQLNGEAEALRAGHAAAPVAVQEFRRALAGAGVESLLVADVLEPAAAPARQIEAALGDAVWALVVAPSEFRRTVIAAREAEYSYPIACAGSGHPAAVLAGARGPEEVLALLADLDVESVPDVGGPGNGQRGAGADGFFHLPSLAQLRAPATPRIGGAARAARLAEIERRLPLAQEERDGLARTVVDAAEQLRDLDEALRLQPELDILRGVAERLAGRAEQAQLARDEAEALHSERSKRADELSPTVGRRCAEVEQLEKQIAQAFSELASFQNQLPGRRQAAGVAQAVADAFTLTEAQRAAAEDTEKLGTTSDLERGCQRAERKVNDEERYPLEIRTEQVLGQRDEQREIVNHAEAALSGVGKDMEGLRAEMDRAREAYDANVNATIRLLDTKFRDVCASAGVVGELRRVAGEGRGEYGLDVLAAHKPGEKPISYQRKNFHSGGQTVKIAILLLLAAMSMGDEGSAEMLIMDEPIAHMSVENADQIAEVIVSLKDKAQFILAMPTNAETLRVDWAEWQISLFGRKPGQARSEPPQILSSLDVDLEARFRSPQLVMQTA